MHFFWLTGFRVDRVPSALDAVVIGSGIGGLTAAALLAKAGKKVLVLEQHDQAGGCTHTFQNKGFEFDVGKKTKIFPHQWIPRPPVDVFGLVLCVLIIPSASTRHPLPGPASWEQPAADHPGSDLRRTATVRSSGTTLWHGGPGSAGAAQVQLWTLSLSVCLFSVLITSVLIPTKFLPVVSREYYIHAGKTEMAASLKKQFPGEEKSIDELMRLMKVWTG